MQFRSAVVPLVLASSLPLLAAGLSGCHKSAEAKEAANEPAVHAASVEVALKTVPRTLRLTGSLEANRDSEVAADASGRVANTFVERGEYVKKGTLLVRLDARSAAISAAQAKADAEAARADAVLRATELSRTQKLIAQKAVPDAELDRAKSQQEAAEQRASSADARLALQAKTIGDASIRAPFDGIIADRWVEEGEYVRPDSRIVTLVDIDTLRLKLTVPEADTGVMKEGQRVAFEVASGPGVAHDAIVRFIGPQFRQSSRDLVVEAVVDNHDRKLKPGVFATARVEAGEQTAVVVPSAALKTAGGTKHVYIVKSARLEERVVQVGDTVGDETIVVSGVRTGERVVARATEDLRDGLRVE